jgi:hypothetical protein
MNCRRHGSKPTLALWMVIAMADVALIVATAGVLTMLLVVAGLVTVAGAVAGFRVLAQRDTSGTETVAVPLTSRRSA